MKSIEEMKKLTKWQKELLNCLYKTYGETMCACTAKIAKDKYKDYRYNNNSLCNRLYRLANKGWIEPVETKNKHGGVIRRDWIWTPRGALLML